MNYYFSKIVEADFETAISKVAAELKNEGFGILTEIDVRKTFKEKLNADFRPYKILGACNPHFAYEALSEEDHIGTMLPCNIIVQELTDGTIEVSAVDPVASMKAIKNEKLQRTAQNVREILKKVIYRV